MRNLHSSKLAARLDWHQVDVLDWADAAARAVDLVAGRAWRALLAVLSIDAGYHSNFHRARAVIADMAQGMQQTQQDFFARIYRRSHKAAAKALASVLPLDALRALSPLPAEVVESHFDPLPLTLAHLLEDASDPSPGQVEVTPRGIRSREPARSMSADAQRAAYERLIFPGPSDDEARQAVAPLFRQGPFLPGDDESRWADILARGVAAGKTQREVAAELQPLMDGSRSRAMRLARTGSMIVAHQARERANEGLGDMMVGQQVHATRDSHTRPEHAARDGTIYYRNPKPGQKGFDEMPRPPLEADGSVAWNCRCWISPVLRPLDEIVRNGKKVAVFKTAEDKLVPDPVDYSSWFAQASARQRQKAVGVRRYAAAKNLLGREPEYADFIEPEVGALVPVGKLQAESPEDQIARRAEVDRLIAQRQQQIRQVALYGFEFPEPDQPTPISPAPVQPYPFPSIYTPTPVTAAPFANFIRYGLAAFLRRAGRVA